MLKHLKVGQKAWGPSHITSLSHRRRRLWWCEGGYKPAHFFVYLAIIIDVGAAAPFGQLWIWILNVSCQHGVRSFCLFLVPFHNLLVRQTYELILIFTFYMMKLERTENEISKDSIGSRKEFIWSFWVSSFLKRWWSLVAFHWCCASIRPLFSISVINEIQSKQSSKEENKEE